MTDWGLVLDIGLLVGCGVVLFLLGLTWQLGRTCAWKLEWYKLELELARLQGRPARRPGAHEATLRLPRAGRLDCAGLSPVQAERAKATWAYIHRYNEGRDYVHNQREVQVP